MYDQKAVKKWRSSAHGRMYYKKYMLFYTHGLTWDFVVRLYEKQQGLCAVCLRALPPLVDDPKSRDVCLEHNHATNDVRGLVHRRCNNIVAYVENLPISLESFIAYLRSSVGVKVVSRV